MRQSVVAGPVRLIARLMALVLTAAVMTGCSATEDQAAEEPVQAPASKSASAAPSDTFTTAEEAVASVIDPTWVYAPAAGYDGDGFYVGPEKMRWYKIIELDRLGADSWRVSSTSVDLRGAGSGWPTIADGWNNPDLYEDSTYGAFSFVDDYLSLIRGREFELAAKRVTDEYRASEPHELSPGDDYYLYGGDATYEMTRVSGDTFLVDTEEVWTSGTYRYTYTVIRGGANYRISARVER